MLRVENMHSGSALETKGQWSEVKLSYVHYNIRLGKGEPCILKLNSVFHHLPNVGSKQLCALAKLECTFKVGAS